MGVIQRQQTAPLGSMEKPDSIAMSTWLLATPQLCQQQDEIQGPSNLSLQVYSIWHGWKATSGQYLRLTMGGSPRMDMLLSPIHLRTTMCTASPLVTHLHLLSPFQGAQMQDACWSQVQNFIFGTRLYLLSPFQGAQVHGSEEEYGECFWRSKVYGTPGNDVPASST
ncbi:hypothetical protein O0I10_006677 [Lichtheimia ornata]|uniref:Uncharacterized protein n=1 Tax=Lichtheimia ornata TaxID=688661 RepID=A0AAD7V2V4_9FUNG|nr:uncharacterized protein O0I10_006677 [Lichtheimia ornata]KAJ8657613.1 hypothetical protein O0I10_006677 [Lichtheimia ornata]